MLHLNEIIFNLYQKTFCEKNLRGKHLQCCVLIFSMLPFKLQQQFQLIKVIMVKTQSSLLKGDNNLLVNSSKLGHCIEEYILQTTVLV